MSNPPESPLRLLAKTYASDLIDEQVFKEILAKLLNKLEQTGELEVQDFYELVKDQPAFQENFEEDTDASREYTTTDWIIFMLGITASLVLGYILYA